MIHPTSRHVAKVPMGMNTLLVTLSRLSNSVLPITPMSGWLNDSAHSVPMMQQKMVTNVPATVREVFISWLRSDVPISCMEIVDVSAARTKRK